MTMYLIDSYAWIEYFLASQKGEVLRGLFSDEGNVFLTVECCLAEIQGWALVNKKDFDLLFTVIRANSRIIPMTEHDWIAAGRIRFEQRKSQKDFGLIDATLLVKQQEHGGLIISGDAHFRNLQNVLFLG